MMGTSLCALPCSVLCRAVTSAIVGVDGVNITGAIVGVDGVNITSAIVGVDGVNITSTIVAGKPSPGRRRNEGRSLVVADHLCTCG